MPALKEDIIEFSSEETLSTMSDDAENDGSLYGPDKVYYKLLLQQNYISDLSSNKKNIENFLQMEHSYSRDWRPMEGAQVMTTRTIMVQRPPQCPSCHVPASDEIRVDMGDQYNPPIPSYNEEAAKLAMEETEKIAINARMGSTDDEDWEKKLNKITWTQYEHKLFNRVIQILDLDHLSRLANKEHQHESVQRRVTIDKSVSRMRQALASVGWEPRLTQWLHGLLMDSLPSSYLASYLDILQTLKSKVPTLVDKMVFGRPLAAHQELLGPVLKKPWEPTVIHKSRRLPNQSVIIIAPCSPKLPSPPSSRQQRWLSLLSSMGQVVQVQMNVSSSILQKQSFSFILDQMVAACRQKIQELRNEVPNRHIVLLGFNAGASLALQVGITEQLSSIICIGFAFNTINGVRGAPDDRILEVTTPVLFVQGQNAARSSQEEIESLREKMQAQTSLVVVGSADDGLRVSKTKRKIESVTQAMVDNMIMDEISEFATTCILNPPGPRDLLAENSKIANGTNSNSSVNTSSVNSTKKRKHSQSEVEVSPIKHKQSKGENSKDGRDAKAGHVPRKVGRPRVRPSSPKRPKPSLLQPPTTEALNMAIQSIIPTATITSQKPKDMIPGDIVTNYEIISPKREIRSIRPAQIHTNPKTLQHPTQLQLNTTPTVKQQSSTTHVTIAPIKTTSPGQRTMQKVKLIPSNQFVQLKPTLNSQSKTFTLKPTTNVTITPGATSSPQVFVRTQPITSDIAMKSANKVYTVKTTPTTMKPQIITTNTQFKQSISQSSASAPLLISPTKFTIIKPTSATTPVSVKTTPPSTKVTPDLSSTNIFDIPIVFADNDGNIQENSQPSNTSTGLTIATNTIDSNVSQLVANRSIVINNIVQPTRSTTTPNKVMLINRNQMKPMPNILSRSIPPLKYTKVVVSNSSALSALPKSTEGGLKPTQFKLNLTPVSKVDLLSGTVMKSSGITLPTTQSATSTVTSAIGKFQPIVINVDSDKSAIKNMIKVNDATSIKPNTILIKSGGLRQIPMIKPGILNRSLTVKKVNLIPQQKILQTVDGIVAATSNNITPITATGTSVGVPTTVTLVNSNNLNQS